MKLICNPIEFVISRFNEDLLWINRLRGKVTIYNKGDSIPEESMRLPNIGRESGTYLTHILRNYHLLADFTVFSQGRFDDHSSDLLERVCDLNGDFGYLTHQMQTNDWNGWPSALGDPFVEIWDWVFGNEPKPKVLEFGVGAIFYASREAILSRPVSFYDRALAVHMIHERAPWVFERLWQYIFQGRERA